MCGGICGACPFAFTDESETIQNYGCLPEPYDILNWKKNHNLNWNCHEDDSKLCVGFAIRAHELGLDPKDGDKSTLTMWNNGELPERHDGFRL